MAGSTKKTPLASQPKALASDCVEFAKSIFLDAIELPEDERESFVAIRCKDNEAAMDLAFKLLQAERRQSGPPVLSLDFGELVATEFALAPVGSPDASRYQLESELGRGGCAIVYSGRQTYPVERSVAIKMLRDDISIDDNLVDRFRFERSVQALMDHPNVARFLDAGQSEQGHPFLVMEMVDGIPITLYCDANKLTVRERLELFLGVCDGVQHAHQKGVIHRDLKPSNILVTTIKGLAVPKVIDFGVAKTNGNEDPPPYRLTQNGCLVGSFLYMSPEQVRSDDNIDARSDVFSLGILLYELLTGRNPFSNPDSSVPRHESLQLRICDSEPRKLHETDPETDVSMVAGNRGVSERSLIASLKGELQLIAEKCLRKNPDDRYFSALELSADILRFLRHEPVEASRPSRTSVAFKYARRNWKTISSGVIVSSIAAACLFWVQYLSVNVAHQKSLVRSGRANLNGAEMQCEDMGTMCSNILMFIGENNPDGKTREIVAQALQMESAKLDRAPISRNLSEIDFHSKVELRRQIGRCYLAFGFNFEAEKEFRKAASVPMHRSDKESKQHMNVLHGLALALQNQNTLSKRLEAIGIIEKVHAFQVKNFPANEVDLAYTTFCLAKFKRGAEAEQHYKSALELYPKYVNGRYHDLFTGIKESYGWLLWKHGKFADATEVFSELVMAHTKQEGASHPSTIRAQVALDKCFDAIGQRNESSQVSMKGLSKKLR